MHRILLLWYREGGNFGDVLLSETVRTTLTDDGYCVEDLEVGTPGRDIFKIANGYDFLLFAGGGIIEKGIPSVIKYYRENKSLLKKPYGIMGIGIGKFDYSNYADTLSEWVDDAKFFFSRDDYTQRYFNNLLGKEKVVYSADCVFFNKRFKNCTILKKNEGKIGLNLRKLPYIDITGDYDWNLLNSILLKIGKFIKIPDCEDATYNLDDGIILENRGLYLAEDEKEQLDTIIAQIKKCKWIIATRYHVVLVAALFGIPSIPIIYCPKVGYLAEQLGIADLAIELGQYDLLEDRVHRLENNYCNYLAIINKNVKHLRLQTNNMFNTVLELIRATL